MVSPNKRAARSVPRESLSSGLFSADAICFPNSMPSSTPIMLDFRSARSNEYGEISTFRFGSMLPNRLQDSVRPNLIIKQHIVDATDLDVMCGNGPSVNTLCASQKSNIPPYNESLKLSGRSITLAN
jgi:hypothetical protein